MVRRDDSGRSDPSPRGRNGPVPGPVTLYYQELFFDLSFPGRTCYTIAKNRERAVEQVDFMEQQEVGMSGKNDLHPAEGSDSQRFAPDPETARLGAVLEHIGDGFLACDADWRLVLVNVAAERMLGMRRQDLLGRNLWSVFPQARTTRLEEEYLRAAAGETRDFENFYEPWGRWFHNRCFPRRGGGMFCYFLDITRQKRVATALRATIPHQGDEESDRTEFVLRFRPDNGVCTFVNDVFCRLFGISREAIVGRAWQPVVVPEDLAQVEAALQRLSSECPVITLETRVYDAAGAVRWLKLVNRGIFADQGRLAEVQVVGRDITERRQLEERYRALVETTTDLIWETDASGNFTYLSPKFEEITGHPPSAFVGRSLLDLLPEEGTEEVGQRLLSALLDVLPFASLEVPIRHRDGRLVLLEVSGVPVTGPDGRPRGLRGISRDVTARKQAEAERQRLHDQLFHAQKMESIGRLAGGVAHDFNNMLSVILSYAEMAMDKVEPGSPLHRDLTEISCAGLRSADIVRRLLTFARKETSAPRVLDLNEGISDICTMIGRLIGEHIDLQWQPGPGPLPVCMDPSQLDQILANLCVNARDAISGVGRITIATGVSVIDQAACARYPDCNPGRYVTLSVEDTGCGMDEATRSRLFEPFFTTKETGAGTGLGLATVFGIVRQMGGCIEVDSEPGRGATVRLFLPAHEGGRDLPNLEDAGRRPPGGTETVLIVDDESSILKIARRMLEKLGYTVLTAPGPSEAVAAASGHRGPIHLLLTDVVMPEMSGRDLVPRIQAMQPGIRVLYMSGYSQHILSNLVVLEAGLPLISKPFSFRELAEKIREVLA